MLINLFLSLIFNGSAGCMILKCKWNPRSRALFGYVSSSEREWNTAKERQHEQHAVASTTAMTRREVLLQACLGVYWTLPVTINLDILAILHQSLWGKYVGTTQRASRARYIFRFSDVVHLLYSLSSTANIHYAVSQDLTSTNEGWNLTWYLDF